MVDVAMSPRRIFSLLLAAGCLALAGCRREPPPEPPPELPPGGPRLVLLVVVDQARHDYMVRFRPLLRHGLRRLLEESVTFADARHDHANTSTTPGHATLATGRHPAHHGMIGNYWLDRQRGERIYGVEDGEGEISPQRLLAPAFGDWLKAASPRSKVFAAGGKDRAAVMLAGRDGDAAFWYDRETGRFVTSPFYRAVDRPWLEAFHRDHYPDRLFGTAWEPLPEVVENAPAYGVEPVDGGFFDLGFPHPLGRAGLAPDAAFHRALYGTPFADRYLGELAAALIDGEGLGRDEAPDFLGLAFSALDAVGHEFGPDSPEVLDALLRLDRILGELLEKVDERIGLEHAIVSLTSDHGVSEIPELLRARGDAGHRFGAEEIACVQGVGVRLARELGDGLVLQGFYLDRAAIAARGLALAAVENAYRRELEGCPGIVRVWTGSELVAGPPEGEMGRLFAHAFHPDRSPDLMVQLEPHTLTSWAAMTNHGSPYAYDTRVPWLLRLPHGRPLEVGEPVRTVDVAPTLAALIGLDPPAELDGVDRGPLFAPALAPAP